MSKDQDNAKLDRKTYEKEMQRLQEELAHLQAWVKAEGARIIIVLEGRDAAGKGGTIKAITERVSPRVFRVVAPPAHQPRPIQRPVWAAHRVCRRGRIRTARERINGPRCEGRKQRFDIAREFGEWCPGAACNKRENSKAYSERAGNVNGPRRPL